jgi:three-Cys-motif partner protein
VDPPFREFFFIDMDGDKVELLRQAVGTRPDVHVRKGDCNQILPAEIFPLVRYEQYRRALCLLDPYGLQLNWNVLRAAGESQTIDLFLNFQIVDANRNALWHDPERVLPQQAARMTAAWGDDSWRRQLYRDKAQGNLFAAEKEKVTNDEVAEVFRRRLRDVAGFAHVPRPIPMRNSIGAVVYYLYFASHKGVAHDIVNEIFRKYEKREA